MAVSVVDRASAENIIVPHGETVLSRHAGRRGAIAKDEITPISDVRGSRDFRLQIAENVLRKFYYDVAGSA